MKRKILISLLSSVLLLSGCGAGGSDTSASSDSTDAGQTADSSEEEQVEEEEPFAGTVVADTENYSIEVTDIRLADGKYTLYTDVTNKFSDESLHFTQYWTSVEGLSYLCGKKMIFPQTTVGTGAPMTIVEPGSTDTIEIYIETADLEVLGIEELTDIKLDFEVYNSRNPGIFQEFVSAHVYPKGEENAWEYTIDPDDIQMTLVDSGGFSASLVSSETDPETGEWKGYIFLSNKSDEDTAFNLNNSSVNGYEMNLMDYLYATIYAGESSFLELTCSKDDMALYGISKIDEIKFDFSASYLNDDQEFVIVSEETTYTITP